ncbi:MAG: iron ABC transporter permease [Chloroflexi bacterium]|nr:iron ABC transporter permease [Chloroflexota bacterium]MBT5627820.1 iron ABC transporter permease [Chloroflexota bacterium]
MPLGWKSTDGKRPPAFLVASAAAVALAALIPVAYLLVRSVSAGSDWIDIIWRANTAAVFGRTFLLIALVTVISVSVAVPIAWLTVKSNIPLRRVLSVASVLPLVMPSFVMATTVIEMYSPKGVLQGWLSAIGVERLPDIYGLGGATLVLVLMTYPYVLLTVRGALRRMDPALEEAARAMGYGPVHTFRAVTLPMLRPAIAGGSLLVALYTLSDFGGVALLRYQTFTSTIMIQYQSSIDRTLAAVLSLVLVVIAVMLLMGEGFTRGRGAYHRSTVGAVRSSRRFDLGRWRWLGAAGVGVPVMIGLIIPVGVLVHWLVRGLLNDQELLPLLIPARNSLYISLLAALATVMAALPVAILAVRFQSRMSKFFERSIYIGFGLPGVVVALSLVFFGINVARPLYQSIWLLIFAYVVLFLPASVGALRSSLLQVSPRVEEAAQSLGRSQWRVIFSVTVPLVMPGALAGGAMVFLLTMKELPATLILSPIGYRTLSASIWSAASEAFFAKTAAAALLLVLVAGVPTAYLTLRGHGDKADASDRSNEIGETVR